jgi:hypothetical protein
MTLQGLFGAPSPNCTPHHHGCGQLELPARRGDAQTSPRHLTRKPWRSFRCPSTILAEARASDQVDNINLKKKDGTRASYLAARIKKQRPDIAAAGEKRDYNNVR